MQTPEHITASIERVRQVETAREEAQHQFSQSAAEYGDRAPRKPGLLVAEGDSWFHYPKGDVLDALDKLGYDIESVAHRGDTIESIAYDADQLDALTQRLMRLSKRDKRPRAILLSGGGNDFTKGRLEALLNHHGSGLTTINETIRDEALGNRVRNAYAKVIEDVTWVCKSHFNDPPIPILVHGYDYSIPDGRGYSKYWITWRGPWLEPAFYAKGYYDLQDNMKTIAALLGYFNTQLEEVLESLGSDYDHVKYIKLLDTLSREDSTYKDDWDNELHPTKSGFARIAKKYAKVIEELCFADGSLGNG